MPYLRQHSAGLGCRSGKKMVAAFLWFLVTGLFNDVFASAVYKSNNNRLDLVSNLHNSTNEISENTLLSPKPSENSYKNKNEVTVLHRTSRDLPRVKIFKEIPEDIIPENNKNFESVQKSPTKSKTFFVIPYLRPGRSANKNPKTEELEGRNTMIPMIRFGRSESDYIKTDPKTENFTDDSKKDDTMNPTSGFDRNEAGGLISSSSDITNSPESRNYLLFKSQSNDDGSLEENIVISVSGNAKVSTEDASDTDEESEDSIENKLAILKRKKRDLNDYDTIIPYPRPGRNIPFNTIDTFSDKEKKSADFDYVLPQIRYGRSVTLLSPPKTQESRKENPHTFVLPYPRPGRSNTYPENGENSKSSQAFMSYPRSSSLNFNDIREGYLKFNKRQNEYMLPTARLGRSNLFKPIEIEGKQSLTHDDEVIQFLKSNSHSMKPAQKNMYDKPKEPVESGSAFMIPYPRPGKRSAVAMKNVKSGKNGKDSTDYILPYPRPGRSEENWFDEDNVSKQQIIDKDLLDSFLTSVSSSKSGSFIYESPMSELSDQYNDDMLQSRYKRSSSVVPYPRPGRSNSIVPYPRPGRSNSIVPYPRPGRSNSVVPYPRPGRSNSVLPYPRLGRSSTIHSYKKAEEYYIPKTYSSSKRSNTAIPYPRPGRSNSVVPYPRPGRSETVAPYQKLGLSGNELVFQRQDNSELVSPYSRLGRSEAVVPYPRPGRSESIVPYPRPGRTLSISSYPRPGQSRTEKTTSSSTYKDKIGNWILPNIRPGRSATQKDETYIIPYPRTGRSEDNNYHLLKENVEFPYTIKDRFLHNPNQESYKYLHILQNSVTSLPVEGVHDTVLQSGRTIRSQKQETPSPETFHSIHKLNKHMLNKGDESIYLLPYPRPGRFTE